MHEGRGCWEARTQLGAPTHGAAWARTFPSEWVLFSPELSELNLKGTLVL